MNLSFNSLKAFSRDLEKETLDVVNEPPREAPIKTCKVEVAQKVFAHTFPGSICIFTNDWSKLSELKF